MKLLDRYIFNEIFKLFGLCLFVLMAILVLEKINFIANMTVGNAISAGELVRLILYTSPAFLVVTIPLAVLLSTLITFSRMSGDCEIIAMRACGVSFFRILFPVLLLAVAAGLLSLWLSIDVLHRGNYLFNSQIADYVSRRFTAALGERTFFNRFPGTVIYVNEKERGSDLLKGIFIFDGSDKNNPRFITAREGMLARTPADNITFRLGGGTMYSGDAKKWRTMTFGEYEMVMNTGGQPHTFTKGERELSFGELRDAATRMKTPLTRYSMEVERQKRLALPFACIILALLAAPLGLQVHRGGGKGGIGLGIMLIVVNYILIMFGESLGREGKLPAVFAMWMPNLVMGLLAAVFLFRAGRESGPLALQIWIDDARLHMSRLFRKGNR